MKMRIITAVVAIPLLLAVLLVAPKLLAALLCAAVCALGAYELLKNTGLVKHVRLLAYSMVSAFAVSLWSFYGMNPLWGRFGILVFFALMFMEMMLAQTKLRFERVGMCVVGGLLVPYLLSALVRIFAMGNGRYFVLIPFVVGFLSDSGAYFIGCKFGKHKLAPVISPKKSVEGVIGGVASAVVGMVIYGLVMQFAFRFRISYANAVLYGFLGALCGVFGDLCFSVVKRQTGIKDYGNIIPGHGGVLDRFDSIILIAPVMELLLLELPLVI